jgi:ribosomal protein L16/L10AE
MRISPRRSKYGRIQQGRWRAANIWGRERSSYGCLICLRRVHLYWYHFETLRLQLAWSLGRRRRLSRKARYRAKQKQVSTRVDFFRRQRRRGRVVRVFWYTGFPHLVMSGKTRGMRMGKGKGDPRGWRYRCYEGTILLQLTGINSIKLFGILRLLRQRLPGCFRPLIVNNCRGQGRYSITESTGGDLWL